MISANSDKLVRSLHKKKYRIKNNKFILEGIRTIDCAINNDTSFSFIIYTKRFSNQNPELISKINCKTTEIVSEKDIGELSPSKSPSGILAIANMIDYGQFNNDNNVVFLDEISDPGNMGTIIRQRHGLEFIKSHYLLDALTRITLKSFVVRWEVIFLLVGLGKKKYPP